MSNKSFEHVQSDQRMIVTIFEQNSNFTKSNFTLSGVLLLNGDQMSAWSEISLATFIWMALPFLFYGACSSLIALFTLRKHPYIIFVLLPFFITTILIPLSFGAPTSMILAYAVSSTDLSVSPAVCMVFGFLQTVIIFIVSTTRLHATL
ncbi:unnamed protein product [Caenorhabditis angaria]|uniref:Uncharacterized protein n=1 Tax=Caenorhabditis angaria TaxID=860376 RepID=A0A9P1I7Q1_9PELO|nr:unnamed protein product [Caenorhabditis angaria]